MKHVNFKTSSFKVFYRAPSFYRIAMIVICVPLSMFAFSSADRPGTPKDAFAWKCYGFIGQTKVKYAGPPSVCVKFTNAVTEDVTFDIEITRNGIKEPNGKHRGSAGCLDFGRSNCTAAQNLNGSYWVNTSSAPKDGRIPEGLYVKDLDFDTKYCFRFKARDMSDTVSLLWSNWACAKTAPVPVLPAAPKVEITFQSREFDKYNEKDIPAKVVITYSGSGDQVSEYKVSASAPHSEFKDKIPALFAHTSLGPTTHVVELPPGLSRKGAPSVLVVVCASNLLGSKCSRPVDVRPPSAIAAVDRKISVGKPNVEPPGSAEEPVEILSEKRPVERPADASVRTLPKPKTLPNRDPRYFPKTVLIQPTCKDGFVWREARQGDYVCVTPQSRQRVADENRNAHLRRDPNGGSGPMSCKQGFVWREAFSGDTVCVPPNRRTEVREENRMGAARMVRQ